MVADGEVVDLASHGADYPATFVSANHRERGHRDIALCRVVVAVTQAGGDHFDEHLGRPGIVEVELFDPPRAWSLA
jgi:hypothetical protein